MDVVGEFLPMDVDVEGFGVLEGLVVIQRFRLRLSVHLIGKRQGRNFRTGELSLLDVQLRKAWPLAPYIVDLIH